MTDSNHIEPRWQKSLIDMVLRKPLVILRLSSDDYLEICESHNGLTRITLARPKELFRSVRFPSACLVFFDNGFVDSSAYFARLDRSPPDTTLEKRIKIERAHAINPQTPNELVAMIKDAAMITNLRNRLDAESDVIPLSPKLSAELVRQLVGINGNPEAMRAAMESMDEPKVYHSELSLQQDAVQTALRVFGIGAHERARLVETNPNGKTALQYVRIFEDVVIQGDARRVTGLSLSNETDLTGRAIFEGRGERLEVITANKLPLEQVFGVDLIYYNAVKKNIVMVQYKMLEPDSATGSKDWIYRPDAQLRNEIARMKRFSKTQAPGPLEYRINSQVYYLKFVRRDAALGKSPQILPIDHYHLLEKDPKCKGPKGGFRVTYDSLGGRYLRQDPFVDLIRAGYIGAYADTTDTLMKVVEQALKSGRSVVAAIHTSIERLESAGSA